ncbi:MAG: PAS domain S-box protein, partial [Planctomycetaceae bacterium]|nr:PAS domain S-box protein [Planctomycetaceae bacterium]
MTQGELQRSTCFLTTERHLFEVGVLKEAGRICALARNLHELFGQTTQLIVESFAVANCGFLLLHRRRGMLRPHESYMQTESSIVAGEIPATDGLSGKTIRTGKPGRVGHVRLDPDYVAFDPRTNSELCLPLRVHGDIEGVLNVEHTLFDAFSEADEQLMMAVVDLVGAALERLKKPDQLPHGESPLRDMLEHMPQGVIVHDGRQIRFTNAKAQEILRAENAELFSGMSPQEIIAPAVRGAAADWTQTLFETQGQSPLIESQFCRWDGEIVDVEMNCSWTRFEGEDCILVHFTDLTSRKCAERDQAYSEQRFRELADAIPQIVWISGPYGGLTHLNAKATEYTGIGMDRLTGWSWDEVIHADDLPELIAVWTKCL